MFISLGQWLTALGAAEAASGRNGLMGGREGGIGMERRDPCHKERRKRGRKEGRMPVT